MKWPFGGSILSDLMAFNIRKKVVVAQANLGAYINTFFFVACSHVQDVNDPISDEARSSTVHQTNGKKSRPAKKPTSLETLVPQG